MAQSDGHWIGRKPQEQVDAVADTRLVLGSSSPVPQSVENSPKTPLVTHKQGDVDFLDPSHPESQLLPNTLSDEVSEELNLSLC
jgi:hypothetical protein